MLAVTSDAGYKVMADYKDAIQKLIGLHVSANRRLPGHEQQQW